MKRTVARHEGRHDRVPRAEEDEKKRKTIIRIHRTVPKFLLVLGLVGDTSTSFSRWWFHFYAPCRPHGDRGHDHSDRPVSREGCCASFPRYFGQGLDHDILIMSPQHGPHNDGDKATGIPIDRVLPKSDRMAIHTFLANGFNNVTVVEQSDRMGGVWDDRKHYPGLRSNNSCNTIELPEHRHDGMEYDDFPTQEQIGA